MTPRCPGCRTRRSTPQSLLRHLKATGHRACNCGHVSYGGTAFPHRPGSTFCIHNPLSALWVAMRQCEPPEVLRDVAHYIVADAPELRERVTRLCAAWAIDINVN